jgi:hypothetical protein
MLCRCRVVALCDAGHQARLGYLFVQVPQPSSPHAHPACCPSFLVLPLVLLVIMSPPWSRPSPWPWPRRAHARAFTLNRAPLRPRTCTHSPGKGENPTLSSLCRSTEAELASVPSRRAEAPLSVVLFHPDGASARLFLSSHGRSRVCTRGPSQAEATPAALPSHSASVRRDAAHSRARSPPVSAPVPLSIHVHPCAP